MIRLSLLGTVALTDAHGRSFNGDVGNKPLALLVYLALEGARGPVRRDKAAAVLWPESANARGSLSTALHTLKSVLGDVVTASGNEDLNVDRSRLAIDCFDFEDLAGAGRLEAAVGLYRGDVADGLFVKDSTEFDAWLSRQQTAWRNNLAAVLTKLFNATVAAGDLTAATSWAEKLLDVAPEKDEPVRQLLPLLIQNGSRPAAQRLYARWKHILAECFDDEPPAELTALIENAPPRKPYVTPTSTPVIRVGEPLLRRAQSRKAAVIAVAVLVVTSISVGWYSLSGPRRSLTASYDAATPKIAVLPFGSGATSHRSANVLNEALQWRLRSVGFQVLNAGRPDTAVIRKLIANDGANGVAFLVGGDVETQSDGTVGARLWLKDAGNGKRIWESRFTQEEASAHLIATQLSEAVTNQIRRAAGSALELAARPRNVSADAWRDVYDARNRMEAALDMRSNGAVAGSLAELREAELALVQVTRAEPDWSLPWVLRARVTDARAMSELMTGNLAGGASELERGVAMLDSVASRLDSEDVYEMRGTLRYRRWAVGIDDVASADRLLADAETDLRAAAAPGRDPSTSYATLSGVMFAQGKFAEAFVYARRAYDSNVFLRMNEEILTRLFNSALHAGDDASAQQWCDAIRNAMPGQWPAVLCRIQIAGFAPGTVDVATLEPEIANLAGSPPMRQVMLPRLKAAYAVTLAQTGQPDSARATLAALAQNQDSELMLFRAFAFAVLKDEPQKRAALNSFLAEHRGTRSNVLRMRWFN